MECLQCSQLFVTLTAASCTWSSAWHIEGTQQIQEGGEGERGGGERRKERREGRRQGETEGERMHIKFFSYQLSFDV